MRLPGGEVEVNASFPATGLRLHLLEPLQLNGDLPPQVGLDAPTESRQVQVNPLARPPRGVVVDLFGRQDAANVILEQLQPLDGIGVPHQATGVWVWQILGEAGGRRADPDALRQVELALVAADVLAWIEDSGRWLEQTVKDFLVSGRGFVL